MKAKLFEVAKVNGEMMENVKMAHRLTAEKEASKRRARKLARMGKLAEALEESSKEAFGQLMLNSIKEELEKAFL